MIKNHALTHKQTEWAYARWCEGYTLIQIGDALHVSYKTIQRAIHGRPRVRPVLTYPGKARGWIRNDIEIALELTCPVCGFMYTEADPKTEDLYKYCPECGAKNE